jgi:UDP-glucose:tetrahydrobiopterin glucosyltransferase
LKKRILFISSPVGAIGSGDAGGIEIKLLQMLPIMVNRKYKIGLIAPANSTAPTGVKLYTVEGVSPVYATTALREAPIVCQTNGYVENMFNKALEVQHDYDVIVSLCFDWLAYYLTPFFTTPLCHVICLSSTINHIDAIVENRYLQMPHRFATLTKAQTASFPFMKNNEPILLYGGVAYDTSYYNFNMANDLCWCGRISAEKGLEDAFEVARITARKLHVCGKMQDETLWKNLTKTYKNVHFIYHGFLTVVDLQKVIGNCAVLLMTARWIEAFGNICVEALATGTPVIAYDMGGPSEIIVNGVNGYLVKPFLVQDIINAVENLPAIKRQQVRSMAATYSYEALTDRYLQFVENVLNTKP